MSLHLGPVMLDVVGATLTDDDRKALADVLSRAGVDVPLEGFRLYGSARKLYHFHVDNVDAY